MKNKTKLNQKKIEQHGKRMTKLKSTVFQSNQRLWKDLRLNTLVQNKRGKEPMLQEITRR